MRKRWMTSCILMAVMVIAVAVAYADDWSYFLDVGSGVSVSFARVDNAVYTWKFRNDGYSKIRYMQFTYSYIDADTGQYKTDTDVVPGSLEPGEVFGGWSAFTANTRSQPVIRITNIDR